MTKILTDHSLSFNQSIKGGERRGGAWPHWPAYSIPMAAYSQTLVEIVALDVSPTNGLNTTSSCQV